MSAYTFKVFLVSGRGSLGKHGNVPRRVSVIQYAAALLLIVPQPEHGSLPNGVPHDYLLDLLRFSWEYSVCMYAISPLPDSTD